MYSDKYSFTLSQKIAIAKNLCAAINAVHNTGQVCGDLNPKNIGVNTQTARVTLFDTDSYHIKAANGLRIYRCEVGLQEYLPRDIQEKMKNGQDLRTAPLPTFSKSSDLFALAVHIFALLMNGCHPFACSVNKKVNIGHLASSQPSVVQPQPIENICTGFFPFYTSKPGITTPKYAPEFNVLPEQIQDLFVRAFVIGHNNPDQRPDSVEWYNALTQLQQNLTTCKNDKLHMYSSHLKKCPWREVENTMKVTVVVPQKPFSNAGSPFLASPTTQPKRVDGVMASSTMFWYLTLAIVLAGQFIFHSFWGPQVIGDIFGYNYGRGIEHWGSNLAIWLGPWGFVICGLIGWYVYNTMWGTSGKTYGYEGKHYVLSIITSFIFSSAWILLIILISIAIALIAVVLIFAFICSLVSGS